MNHHLLFLFAFVILLSELAPAQTFSDEKDYVEFYKERYNPKHEYSSEPTVAVWWIIEQFGNAEVAREKRRDYLSRHLEHFADGAHAGLVKSHLDIIKRMLDEKRPGDNAKVEQLIYDLRDLNLRQFTQPNEGLKIHSREHSRWEVSGSPPDVPEKLAACGYDAVALLIDHIDDKMLTRSVDYWRDLTFSHRVLTVGECCKQILDKIVPTGQVFDLSKDPAKTKEAMKRCYRILIEEKIEWEETKKRKK